MEHRFYLEIHSKIADEKLYSLVSALQGITQADKDLQTNILAKNCNGSEGN